MKLPLNIVLLIALSVAQVGAAALSILRYETTLAWGTLYKVKTAPVDPADPFRGRYVAIRPAVTLVTPSDETERVLMEAYRSRAGRGGDLNAYVVLGLDAAGFARVEAIVADPPRSGDYLAISQTDLRMSPGREDARGTVLERVIILPFDRYYMSESAAPAAEERYRAAARRNDQTEAWITVRVRNGRGVVEGLYIDGVPIEVAARQAPYSPYFFGAALYTASVTGSSHFTSPS
jgi:uncharacterized membrane-anchored protein